MSYCALRFSAAVVLPKWLAARTASLPICSPLAALGSADALSYQTPASAPPVGYADVRAAGAADLGTGGDALAVLRHHAGPQLAVGTECP